MTTQLEVTPPWSPYDELRQPDGAVRAHWRPLLEALELLGPEELTTRGDAARRILRDHGVNYDPFGDRQGIERPWELDLVPVLLSPEEWSALAAGLIQRTRLLNALLADVYGPQRLLREQHLPAAVVHANPDFLRPCHGWVPAGGLHIVLHAIDLARGPDGQWRVIGDHTQSPGGTGYALENRIILSRVMPEEFRSRPVQRLARFFQDQRETLGQLATDRPDQPSIVLLTGSSGSDDHFEHTYLARYLGFPLVEDADLTVRDGRVFLKTLEGLQPVQVIVRGIPDDACDPLELTGRSQRGIPGLVQAARGGRVALANALGTGVVEAPAIAPFLPALCPVLLGESLILPGLPSAWCGLPAARQHVCDAPGSFVLRRAFAADAREPLSLDRLTPAEREARLVEIRQEPHAFVAQEHFPPSLAPTWTAAGWRGRPLHLRAFVCASPQGISVLPGGLVRVSNSSDLSLIPMRSGGSTKDVWVLSDQPVPPLSLLRDAHQPVRLERAAAEMPSRVADNLFWLGRYAERLEDLVRILRCLLGRLVGESRQELSPELDTLVRLLVRLDLLPEVFRDAPTLRALERETFALLYTSHRLGTVREVLGRLHQIAWTVRDRFSADTWRIFNKLRNDARPRAGRVPLTEAHALLNTVIVDLAAFSGLEMENMTRGHGWRFLDLGRRLERAANITSLARATLEVQPGGQPLLESVLEIADSVMTYRRRYFAPPQLAAVLDLLLVDDANPRALLFQLDVLRAHAAQLPVTPGTHLPGPEAQAIAQAQRLLERAPLPALDVPDPPDAVASVREALDGVAAELRGLSNTITHHYFSHADTRVG